MPCDRILIKCIKQIQKSVRQNRFFLPLEVLTPKLMAASTLSFSFSLPSLYILPFNSLLIYIYKLFTLFSQSKESPYVETKQNSGFQYLKYQVWETRCKDTRYSQVPFEWLIDGKNMRVDCWDYFHHWKLQCLRIVTLASRNLVDCTAAKCPDGIIKWKLTGPTTVF